MARTVNAAYSAAVALIDQQAAMARTLHSTFTALGIPVEQTEAAHEQVITALDAYRDALMDGWREALDQED